MTLLLWLLTQDFTVIDSGGRGAKLGDAAVYERIDDEAGLKALWERLPSSQKKKEMPKVDFSSKMVLAVVPSVDADRHQLRIESLKQEKDVLILTYSLTPLAVEGGPGYRIPYVLIATPRSKESLQVVELVKAPAGKATVQERVVKTIEGIK